jgi:PAS domain S-box-containing protein
MPKQTVTNRLLLEQVVDRQPLTAAPATSVREAIARLSQGLGNCLVVLEGKRLLGLFRAEEVVKLIAAGQDLTALTLAEVMQPAPVTLTFAKTKRAHSAWTLMRQHQLEHLPVLDRKGNFVGLVTQARLLAELEALTQAEEAEAATEAVLEDGDRSPADQSLSFLQDVLQAITEDSPYLIFRLDRQLRYLYVSPNVERILGVRPEQLLGKTLREAGLSPELCKGFEAAAAEALGSGETVISESDYAGQTYLSRLIPEQLIDGSIRALIGIVIELSESRQLTLALQASQADLHRIFEVAAAAICSFRVFANRDWEYDYFSSHCETLFGYSSQELVSSKHLWISRVPDEDRETILMPLFEDFFAERNVKAEHRFYHQDGSLCWISTSYASQQIAPDEWLVIAVNTDITERKESELARERSQKRLHFALQATQTIYFEHDLKTNQVRQTSLDSDQDVHSLTAIDEIFEYAHPEDRERATQTIKVAIAHRRPFHLEFRLRSPQEAQWSWKLVRGTVLVDHLGQPTRLIGVSIDITERKQAEVALDQLSVELNLLYDEAPCGYHSLDPEGRVIRINKTELNMLGYSWEEVVGRKITDFLTPKFAEGFHHNYSLFIKNGGFEDRESQFIRKDGSIITVRLSSTAVYDQAGKYLMSRSIVMDVSDRAALEAERDRILAELKISEEKRRLALDLTSTAVWDWDVKTGSSYWSDYLFELFGLPLGLVEPGHALWQACVHPIDLKRVEALISNCLNNKSLYQAEYRVIHPDESVHWVMSKGQAIYDEAGQPVRMLGITMDITSRKQLEADLRLKEEQLRLALDLNAIGLWEWQIATGTCSWNDHNFRLLGFEPGEVEPSYQLWHDFIHPDDVANVDQKLAQAIENRAAYEAEFRVVLRDGSIGWQLVKGRVLCDEFGQPVRMLGVAFDITARKQAELRLLQQALRDQLIAELATSIRQSLDLNQVLTSTVEGVRAALYADRVILVKRQASSLGAIITESVEAPWPALTTFGLTLPSMTPDCLEAYRQGRITTIDDLAEADLQASYAKFLQQSQARASLVAPLGQGDDLWGFLMVHHCKGPHRWQAEEVELVRQLSSQIQIAIQHSELYQQLQASEERYRALCSSAPIGICQTDTEGNCTYSNARWQEMSGLSNEQSLGAGWIDAVHPGDRPALFAAWEAYLKGNGDFCHVFRLLRPQGDIRWLEARAAAIRAETGEIIGYVGTDMDITERKQAEAELHRSQQLLQTILDQAPAAIYLFDEHNRFVFANRHVAELLSIGVENLIGKTLEDLWPKELVEPWATNNQTVRDTLQLIQVEEVVESQNEKRTYLTIKFPLPDEFGQPNLICGISTDITAKKKLEEQALQAKYLEILSTLASGIAHELNNILTPILAIAQLLPLKYPDVDERTRQLLTALESSARRGAEVVKQILLFAPGQATHPVLLEIAHLLRDVFRLARRTFPANLAILLNLPHETLWLVSADATQLHQVFMNLAIKVRDTLPDGGQLTFAAENVVLEEPSVQRYGGARVGPYVRVTIAAKSYGMDLNWYESLFDALFTTHATGQSTDLGLASIQSIVNTYDGLIQFATEPKQGSAFRVYLPALPTALPENKDIQP